MRLAYINNPETDRACLPSLSLSALQLRPGATLRMAKRTASTVLHALDGSGTAVIAHSEYCFSVADVLHAVGRYPMRCSKRMQNAVN